MSPELAPVDPSVSKHPIAKDATDLATVCVLCSHNCGIRVDVADGKITDVRADDRNPITHGYICNKGFSVGHYAHHDQRVTEPLRRRADGSFEEISWDTAIAEISAKLVALRDEHGPRSIALVGVGGQANHMDGPFALSFLMGLGSLRWFNAFAQEKHQHALIDQWVFDAPPMFFHPDTANAELLIVTGSNPRISNRGHAANETFKKLAADKNRRMIVIDPRATETTKDADRHIQLEPGTDAHFLLGLAASIANTEGLADAKFIAERTNQFEQLRTALERVDVDEMARRCGIPTDAITETAREFATAKSASILYDLAVEHAPFSTLISYLIRIVCALSGQLGKPGTNHFMESASVPTRSKHRFDEPERTVAAGIRGIPAIGGAPMFSPTLVPEEVMVDHPERIRALFIEGSNPYLSFSDTNAWREAREKLELMVVVEPAMSETAEVADYVLPTPCGYEKWETSGFPKGYPEIFYQLRPPVIPGPPNALPEPEIYARLAEACGVVTEPPAELFELAKNADTPEGAAAYFAAANEAAKGHTPSLLFWGYRTLGRELPSPALISQWVTCMENAFGRRDAVLRVLGDEWSAKGPFDLALELFRRIVDHPEGVQIAKIEGHADNLTKSIGYDDDRLRLAPAAMLAEIQRAIDTPPIHDPDYPFILASGLRTRWNANTIQRNPAWRKGRGPHCALHLSPNDAEKLDLAKGDLARISTRRGAVVAPVEIDKKLRDGHVWIPNGFGMRYPSGPDGALEMQGVNLNELSDAADRDPISGCPHHKRTPVAIERVED